MGRSARRIPRGCNSIVTGTSLNLEAALIRVLSVCSQCGTLREAAARLETHPSTVSRRIDALEQQLGYRVIERGSDGLKLTDAGRELAPLAVEIEERLWAFSRNASFIGNRQSSDVIVQAPEGLGTHWIFTKYSEQGGVRGIKINLICSDVLPDLRTSMVDISVQYTPATNPGYVQKRLGYLQVIPFASKTYVAAFGIPRDAADLKHFRILSQVGPHDTVDLWHEYYSEEELQALEPSILLRTNSGSAQYYGIKGGMGIGGLPTYGLHQDKDIVPIDIGITQTLPIYAVYQKERVRNKAAFNKAMTWLQSIFDARTYRYFDKELWLPDEETAC